MLHSFSTFIGHLHPVLVHLPIGFLLMALLLHGLSGKPGYTALSAAVPVVLLSGVFAALLSCISGLLLSSRAEYDSTTVILHMWMGIATTLVSAWLYAMMKSGQKSRRQINYTGIGLFLLITITGHLGGSLTHGSDYLTAAFTGDSDTADTKHIQRQPIADIQEAKAFDDVILPILLAKCKSCHGPAKQKGRLRMDRADWLMKGGKNGPVILPGKPGQSELIKRLALPPDDEHHMAPKEKPQVTTEELALLSWWIAAGADTGKKVRQLEQPAVIKPLLLALQTGGQGVADTPDEIPAANADIPADPVDPADAKSLAALRAKGVMVLPVAQNSHYLEVDCLNFPGMNDNTVQLLLPLRKQLLSLKLSHTAVSDASLKTIGDLTHLLRLHLDHTAITGKGLGSLGSLQQLKYLNLVGTRIDAEGLSALRSLHGLKTIYLYQTRIDRSQWPALQAAFKSVVLDSGGYHVGTLPTDTQIVKPPPPLDMKK